MWNYREFCLTWFNFVYHFDRFLFNVPLNWPLSVSALLVHSLTRRLSTCSSFSVIYCWLIFSHLQTFWNVDWKSQEWNTSHSVSEWRAPSPDPQKPLKSRNNQESCVARNILCFPLPLFTQCPQFYKARDQKQTNKQTPSLVSYSELIGRMDVCVSCIYSPNRAWSVIPDLCFDLGFHTVKRYLNQDHKQVMAFIPPSSGYRGEVLIIDSTGSRLMDLFHKLTSKGKRN